MEEQTICIRCRKLFYDGGKKTCPACRDSAKKMYIYHRNQRIRKGLCPYCGKRTPEDGRAMCEECRIKTKVSAIKRSRRLAAKNGC